MVIAHPISNSDNNLSNETLVADQDGNVINSNSLESVPSLINDVCRFFSLFFLLKLIKNTKKKENFNL